MGKIIDRFHLIGYIFTKEGFRIFNNSLWTIKNLCNEYKTCDGCPFRKEHVGCMFRDKTPREW